MSTIYTYNATTPIVPQLLRADAALVTLGILNGNAPSFEVFDAYKVEQWLDYHFLCQKNTTEYDVVNKPFIPQPGANYVFNGTTYYGLVAREIKPSLVESINEDYDYWIVSIKFFYEWTTGGSEAPAPTEADPFTISSVTRYEQRPAWRDLDGKKVVNSAGRYLDPPVMYDFPITTYTIQRVEYRNPHANKKQFEHCVNSSTFWGYGSWKVLLENMNVSENFIPNMPRKWSVTYELSVRDDEYGWKTAILDQGTVEKTSDNKWMPIKNDDNSPVSSPVPMDGQGKKLDTSGNWTPVFEWNGGSPFKLYQEADLNQLRLPNPMQ